MRAAVCVRVLGDEFEVHAKCVINATGPYTDFVRRLDLPKCRKICQPSSGIHVVLPDYYRSEVVSSLCILAVM